MMDPEHIAIIVTNLAGLAAVFMRVGAMKLKLDTLWEWWLKRKNGAVQEALQK